MPRVICRTEICIGCHLCEVYCTVRHSRSRMVAHAYKEKPKPVPRVMVEEAGHRSQAVPCQHCSNAPCLEVCISGAMSRDGKTGAVVFDQERCVGCRSCVMICPFGAVVTHPEGRTIVVKCDLCSGDEVPQCVLNCPNRALVLEKEGDRIWV